MNSPDTPYRGVRGWCLGSQIPMRIRNAMKSEGTDCDCSYSRPYLHSLVMTFRHWDGPVMRNEPDVCQRLRIPSGVQRHWDKWATGTTGMRNCPVRGCPDCRRAWSTGRGGWYSYHPAHIERMGNWDDVHVLGVVSCFGDIAIHRRGYRSDIVRIDQLWVLRSGNLRYNSQKLQSFLEDTYECPVKLLKRTRGFTEWVKGENIDRLVRFGESE